MTFRGERGRVVRLENKAIPALCGLEQLIDPDGLLAVRTDRNHIDGSF
jgi:hypothetical protein